MDAAQVKPKPQPRLGPERFEVAEFKQHVWRAFAEQGVTLETLKDPAYWANWGHRMTPWDMIIVTTEDGTLWAELLVLSCGRTYANVKVLRSENLTTADVEQTQGAGVTQSTYQYVWKGPNKRHCIVRSDGEIVHEGSQTKVEAVAWAVQNKVVLTTA